VKIIYHHRTRSTDAQRIHILEIVHAFQSLKHDVEIVSLVPTEKARQDAKRDAGNPLWQRMARRIPFLYEMVQIGYNVFGVPMLLWKVARAKADFIYERYSLFNFTGVLVAKLCGVPIILEVNSPFAMEQGRDKDIRLERFAGWTERVICNLATRVIVVSTSLAKIMQASGVHPEKIQVMTNGVRLDHFQAQPQSMELRKSLGLGVHEKVIGFVGWFRKWHGLELLLDAFRVAGFKRGEVRLMLIGDGQAMQDLQQLVRDYELTDSVFFTGPLPHDKVPEYLDLIDIAVQPAANEYCCPMKILEYMALGKAIVAPRQENIRELLREGDEAQYFAPGDANGLAEALRALVNDPGKATDMGRRAREAVSRRGYLWTANAERVLEMVEQRDRLHTAVTGNLRQNNAK
jgi:glycosyltransferase involved in cell wall biosynthesis